MSEAKVCSPEEVKARLKSEALAVEDALKSSFESLSMPDSLKEAMSYSLMAGGKRIRPVLLRVCAGLAGLEPALASPFAVALECIHTYSLIHDDLPAMDDDDLRRGRPSCHKQFDEATAILAGDALLTDAFFLMASAPGVQAKNALEAIRVIAEAAGSGGMVGGQVLDIYFTARDDIGTMDLAAMHAMKTGALIRSACEAGASLGGLGTEEIKALSSYGVSLGAAFQITDDILDTVGDEKALGKPIGSDKAKGKITYVSLIGVEKSRDMARERVNEALSAIKGFSGDDAAFLRGLAVFLLNRVD